MTHYEEKTFSYFNLSEITKFLETMHPCIGHFGNFPIKISNPLLRTTNPNWHEWPWNRRLREWRLHNFKMSSTAPQLDKGIYGENVLKDLSKRKKDIAQLFCCVFIKTPANEIYIFAKYNF